MQVDYFELARQGRIAALAATRQQPELPGFGEPKVFDTSEDPVSLEAYRVRDTEPEVDLSFFRSQRR
ncbi:MAG: hypothetical protein AAGK67_12860 [Pseudomonadota bacterium]